MIASTAGGRQRQPSAGFEISGGRYVIAWADDRPWTAGDKGWTIHARTLGADWNAAGDDTRINTTDKATPSWPAVAARASRKLWVAWSDVERAKPNKGAKLVRVRMATLAVCGNGAVEPAEECDDGNGDDGDGCSAGCLVEVGCVGPGGVPTADCDDGDACTVNTCVPAVGCVYEVVSCDDGLLCTVDGCDAATGCVHAGVSCDDGDDCTTESCDAEFGCVYAPVSCDDGVACTVDSCDPVAGCQHAAGPCSDGDLCTVDTCDVALGCVSTPAPCEDENPCTADVCDVEFGCVHIGMTCDDGVACTVDSCDPATGCEHVPGPCSDGDLCTVDTCDVALGCVSTPAPCEDENPCTADVCDVEFGCVHIGASCDDGIACTTDSCDPQTGCTHTALGCDDGDACTADGCDAQAGCTHAAIGCDDGDACTADGCDAETGCTHQPISCDDGSACTTDACNAASGCTHEAVNCDDGDACTGDSCDVGFGCVHVSASCDDGLACTTDSCDAQTGCQHTALGCDDGDACTADGCDAQAGCTHAPISCDDGDACTTDACDVASGCTHQPVSCDDGSACTTDSCNAASGCENAPVSCDDGSACTTDTCAAASGCTHQPISCDDGSACTTDACNAASGCTHEAVNCDDGDACTGDSCDVGFGCVHVSASCDDGLACTTDSCDAQTGCQHTALGCDDGDACTTDGCDAQAGCTHAPISCDDGDACTTDACDVASGCTHQPVSCDDGSACTTDSCNAASGCENAAVSCDDGSACTTDTCAATSGCTHQPISCDDGSACTTDACNAASGCTHEAVNCDDGDACTGDSCDVGFGCVHVSASCDDGLACTTDSCDAQTGCQHTALGCDDGDACTTDGCDAQAGCTHAPISCDDGDACTTDACDVASGCTHQPVSCDDGSACTTDSCNAASGCENAPVSCDDGDACTSDACNPASGCTHQPVSCDDDSACTTDSCNSATGCVHTGAACALYLSVTEILVGVGYTATVSVQLSAPAGPGGITVTLGTSPAGVASVAPLTATIPEGANSLPSPAVVTGLAPGQTTLTASAPDHQPDTATVTVVQRVLQLPAALLVGPGLQATVPVLLTAPAPPGGLTLSFSTGNPALATVTPEILVPAGATAASATLTGVASGSTTVAVSAPGWDGDSGVLLVQTVVVSFDPAGDYRLPTGGTSSRTVRIDHPAPAGGLVIDVSSADDAIATAAPATVTIPAGQLVSPTPVVIAAPGIGTVSITASRPGLVSGSLNLTADVGSLVAENCPAGTSVGAGLQHSNCYIRVQVGGVSYAPIGGLSLVVVSATGRSSATAIVSAGTDYAYGPLVGISVGADTQTFSAPLFGAVDLPVAVEPARLTWVGVDTERSTLDPLDDAYLYFGTAGVPTGESMAADTLVSLSLAPGSTSGIVAILDGGLSPVTSVLVPAGASYLGPLYASQATVDGTYRLRASAPGFAVEDSEQVSVVTSTLALSFENCGLGTFAGVGVYHSLCYVRRLQNGQAFAPPTPLTLTFTSVSGHAAVAETVMPAGYDYAYVVLAGVSLGADTLTVSADDALGAYAPDALAVTVEAPTFRHIGLDTARNPLSLPDDFYLQYEVPSLPGSAMYLVADTTVDLSLSPGSTAGIVEFQDVGGTPQDSLLALADSYYVGYHYVSQPTTTGTYAVRAEAPGFAASDSAAVSVSAGELSLSFENCGAGYFTAAGLYHGYCYVRRHLNGATHAPQTPLTLTFTSATGRAFVADVTIPAGYDYAYFALEGESVGEDVVTVTAMDDAGTYTPAALPVTVEEPVFIFSGIQTQRSTLSPRNAFWLQATSGSLSGNAMYARADLIVPLSTPNATPPGIVSFYDAPTGGTLVTETLIPAGTYYTPYIYISQPTATGSYRVRAEAAGLYSSDSALVTVVEPELTLHFENCSAAPQTVGVGLRHSGCYIRARLNGQAYAVPADLDIAVESSDPAVVLPQAVATISAGGDFVYVDVVGVQPGNAVITASAPGYALSELVEFGVVYPEILLSGVPTSIGFDPAGFYIYTLAAGQYQPAHVDLEVALESNDPAVLSVDPVVIIPAGLYYGLAYVYGNTDGTATFDGQIGGLFGATSPLITVTTGLTVDPGSTLLTYLPGVVAAASSEWSAGYEAAQAADHSLSTAWVTNAAEVANPSWWQITFPAPVTVDGLYYWTRDNTDFVNPALGTFAVYDGDPDGGGTLLDEISGVALPTGISAEEWYGFALPVDGVSVLRFTVANPGGDVDQAAEFIVVGTP
jgi:cysteine-rich repeat protein